MLMDALIQFAIIIWMDKMGNLIARNKLLDESKERISKLRTGDKVTNISASESNPSKRCVFAAHLQDIDKNSYGLQYVNHYAICTDSSWNTSSIRINSIHPGHLSEEESKPLFDALWDAEYGEGAAK